MTLKRLSTDHLAGAPIIAVAGLASADLLGLRFRAGRWLGIVMLAGAAAIWPVEAHAAAVTYTLISGASGNWSTGSNWGGTAASGAGNTAQYNTATTASTITLDAAKTIGQLQDRNTGNWTINASGSIALTLDNTGGGNDPFGNANSFVGTTSSGVLTFKPNLVISNTDLDIGATSSGNVTIAGNITATSTGNLKFFANGAGAVTVNGSIGNGGGNINIQNQGGVAGGGTVILAGSLGSNVTGVTQNSTTSKLILSSANSFTAETVVNNAGSTIQLNNGLALQYSTVSLNADNGLTFNSGITTVTLGGLQGAGNLALTDNNTLAPHAVNLRVGNNNTETIFAGVLSGGGSLTKIGQGTLLLTASNTYTGTTTVTAGTLRVGATGALPANTSQSVSSGATLDLNGFDLTTTGIGTGNGSHIALGGATLTFDNSSANTFYGTILGPGRLVKTGSEVLDMQSANSYSGTTVVSAGVFRLSAAGALPGGTGVTGGTSNLTLNGGVVELAATDLLRSLGNGPDQVQFTGSGGFSAYGMTRAVNFGGGSAQVAWGSGGFVPDGQTLVLGSSKSNATVDLRNPIDLGSAIRTIFVDKGTASINAKLSGVLSGGGGLAKTGPGSLGLLAANTYTGPTMITGGVLRLSYAGALPGGTGTTGGASNLTLNGGVVELEATDLLRSLGSGPDQVQFTGSGGFSAYGATRAVNFGGVSAQVAWGSGGFVSDGQTLVLGSSKSNATVDLQNPIDLGSAARTVQADDGSATVDAKFSGTIVGSGSLTKTGAGTLALVGSCAYSGGTTIAAGTLQVGSGGVSGSLMGTVTNNSVLAFNRSDDYVFGNSITGLGNVSQLASGTVTLSGVNSYQGSTNISKGTLRVGAAGALPSGTAITVSPGATLDLNGLDYTIGRISSQGTVALGAGTLTINNNGQFAWIGATTGTGALVNSGVGEFLLSGPIMHTGGIVNLSGETRIYECARLPGAVTNYGTLEFWYDNSYSGVKCVVDGSISGPGVVMIDTCVDFAAANSYTGLTDVNGILRLSHPDALPGGTGVTGGKSNLVLRGGGVELAAGDFFRGIGSGPDQVKFAGSARFAAVGATRVVNIGGQSAQLAWGTTSFMGGSTSLYLGSGYANATLDFQNPQDVSLRSAYIQVDCGTTDVVTGRLSGVISGSGSLNVISYGNGTLDLTGVNTYTGGTYISGCVLRLSRPLALPGGVGPTGGTSNLRLYDGIVELGSGDFLRPVGSGPNAVRFYNSGGGGFSAWGGDRVVNLGGAGDKLICGDGYFIGQGYTLTLGLARANGTLDFQNAIQSDSYDLPIEVNDGTRAVDAKLSGILSGVGGFRKRGLGTLELTAANIYAGVTRISAGVLRLSNPLAMPGGTATIGGTSNLAFGDGQHSAGGGVLELAAGNFSRGLGTGPDQVQFLTDGGFSAYGADRTVNLGGASVPLTWGTGNFVGSGALILSSPVANAVVDFQNPIDLGSATRMVRVDDGSATVDAKLSGALSGSGGLTKTNAGTLALTADNTYTGPTTVSAGRLLVNGTHGGGVYTVAGGATLGGTGTIGALGNPTNVTIVAGGILAPGASIGTLSVNGDITLHGALAVELDGTGAGASDVLNVLGTLDITNSSLDLHALTPLDDPAYVLANYATLVGDHFGDVTGLPAGYHTEYQYQGGNQIALVVPEPSTLVLLGIGALGLIGWRWRSRRGYVAAFLLLLSPLQVWADVYWTLPPGANTPNPFFSDGH